jgi:hypothetical protein
MICRDCPSILKENERIVCKECEKYCISLEGEKENIKSSDVPFGLFEDILIS